MYVFSDPRVLDMLQRTVTCYSRIGEFLSIETSASSFDLSVMNSSQSVLGSVSLVPPLFSGSGDHRCLQVKARALDLVLRRLESQKVFKLIFMFKITPNGQEQLVVAFNCADGVSKNFVLPSLDALTPPASFVASGNEVFAFECLPSVLKSASASCESTADEIQLMFRPSLVSFLAQKRSNKPRKSLSTVSTADFTKAVANNGLKTLIKLQFDAFSHILVPAPRQLDLKFKEFRTMLTFFHQMIGRNVMRAEFPAGNQTTIPVLFSGKFFAYPRIQFIFKFLARSTTFGNELTTNISFGVPSQQNESQLQREAQILENFASEETSEPHRRKLRRIEPFAELREEIEAEECPPSPRETDEPSSPREIGCTQPYEPVRGLFD